MNENQKVKAVYWIPGMTMMFVATMIQFGFTAVLFWLGLLLWDIGKFVGMDGKR